MVDLLDSLSNKIKKKIRLKYEHDKFEKERLNLSKEIIELKNELHLTSKETSEIVDASLNKLKKMEDANSSIDILDYQFAVMDLLSLKFEQMWYEYESLSSNLKNKSKENRLIHDSKFRAPLNSYSYNYLLNISKWLRPT